MKTTIIKSRTLHFLIVTVALVLTNNSLKAQSKKLSRGISVTKSIASRKYKIKLFPNATQEVLFFNAIGEAGKVYQFYLFDIDGNLVKQTQIRNRETTMLTDFAKGEYTFEVFSNDERIENGILSIR